MIALALIATLLATQMAPARQSTAAAQTQGDAADAACIVQGLLQASRTDVLDHVFGYYGDGLRRLMN